MSTSDIFVVAIWAATTFGLLEGVLLNIARFYPVLLAPYKASAHMLWIAPLVDIPLFLFAAMGLAIFVSLIRGSKSIVVYGFFFFLGFFTVVEALQIIHLASIAVLSLGCTVFFCSKLCGLESRLTTGLRRRLVWIPIVIFAMGLSVFFYDIGKEKWQFEHLPAVQAKTHAVSSLI
jgi:hypothetical protein